MQNQAPGLGVPGSGCVAVSARERGCWGDRAAEFTGSRVLPLSHSGSLPCGDLLVPALVQTCSSA